MKSISVDVEICRNPEQVFNEIDGQVVMLDVLNETYYNLDDIGSTIWRELENPCSIEQLISKLVTAYEVSYNQCKKDIEPFIQELISAGVVKIVHE